MADARAVPFTDDEVHAQAVGNANVFALALVAYARTQGQAPAAVARWLGQRLAPGWSEEGIDGARAAARTAALNVVSLGGELRSLSGDERQAEATVTGWPEAELLGVFSLSQEEADTLQEAFVPIGERLGLRFAWRREGETLTLSFTQAESA